MAVAPPPQIYIFLRMLISAKTTHRRLLVWFQPKNRLQAHFKSFCCEQLNKQTLELWRNSDCNASLQTCPKITVISETSYHVVYQDMHTERILFNIILPEFFFSYGPQDWLEGSPEKYLLCCTFWGQFCLVIVIKQWVTPFSLRS